MCRLYGRILRLIGQANRTKDNSGRGVIKLMVSASTTSTFFPHDSEFVSTVLMSEDVEVDDSMLDNLGMRRYSAFEI